MSHRPATRVPPIDTRAARALLRDRWQLNAEVEDLPGERDRNFRVTVQGSPHAVLKVVHPDEPASALDMQEALLRHIARTAPTLPAPRLITPVTAGPWIAPDGVAHAVRLVEWQPGEPFATATRDPAMFTALGDLVGRLTRALQGFGHPGAHRDMVWDPARASEARGRLSVLQGEELAIVERALEHVDAMTPRLERLRHGVLHGDLNDWNVLVEGDRITGIIDVGDAIFGPVIADLAIAMTYAAMAAASPLTAMVAMTRAYRPHAALDEDEAELLIDLVRGRLCTSLTISALRRAEAERQDPYWYVSEQKGWALLRWLDGAADAHLRGALRQAAGHGGTRTTAAFRDWLATRPALHPPLASALSDVELHCLSWTSPDDPMVQATLRGDHAASQAAWDAVRDEQHFDVGIGQWGEQRAIYGAPAFTSRLLPGQRRDLHLGLDLFADAGTALHAPLDSAVVAVAICDQPQDYGGVVLLEHSPEGGPVFRTLWGHLDPASTAALQPGSRVGAGAPFARLGAAEVNGGWVPHLHLQVVLTEERQPEGVIGVGEAPLRDLWADLYPDPAALAGLPPEVLEPADTPTVARLRAARLPGNLSLSYRTPLHIVRGEDVHLIDARGRRYLDCYNNVAHVGHCHPRVVAAIAKQAKQLNTNTRYLHRLLGEYADRLVATFPPGLDTVFFTNSGSEANELALRLARTVTGRRDLLVLDWAYHGHTQALIECSPYKYKRAGGAGRAPHIHEIPCPDLVRRPDGWNADDGYRWAEAVEAVVCAGVAPAAMIVETIPSCAGQVVLPHGFLARSFEAVRGAGGLCIADEVQVGFGRVGNAMWAFEEHGVVPDIVTLGKPMGNGHPIGAMVTSRRLADAFANGMEYFNTFAGNPVSCAAGLAVLDVLRDEGLLQNALQRGAALRQGLQTLAARHPTIVDVRGRGLFLGAELAQGDAARSPATALAARIVDHCCRQGVLLGTDGPHANVLKIRPPMTLTADHADRLLGALGEALEAAGPA